MQRKGESQYNPIFEFRCHVLSQSDDMVFSSMTGHMMELEFPEAYQYYTVWVGKMKIMESGRSRVTFSSACL